MNMPSDTHAPPERVRDAFDRLASSIARKENIPAPRIHYREVANLRLEDDSAATLWVGEAEGAKSVCYHVDVAAPDGVTSAGIGSCRLPGHRLDLDRHGTLVIGSAGRAGAVSVQVSTRFGEARVPAAIGHFMVPPDLAPDASVRLAIRLFDAAGALVGEVTDTTAPGSSDLE